MRKNRNGLPNQGRVKSVSYAKWGWIFIIPFFLVYITFTLVPQVLTIGYSFTDCYTIGLDQVGPEWNNFGNYIKIFSKNNAGYIPILRYLGNTMVMWIICAVPQFVVALLLAVIFTSSSLRIKFQGFFKTLFYMPNVIMASAFGMLFYELFAGAGPVNDMLKAMGIINESYLFLAHKESIRILIAVVNYLMWFGNTTIMLMAGIQGIDDSIFESAKIDGSSGMRQFFDITMPLLKPIFIYVLITSMIGGIQMYDVPQILTNGSGTPDNYSMTVVMYLNNSMTHSNNYGQAGAISMVLFLFSGALSILVWKFSGNGGENK